jgi:hypothetical protein
MNVAVPRASILLMALIVALTMLSSPASAEKRSLVYYNKTGPVLSRTVATPGDVPDHEVVQATRQDMTTSPDPDWNDVPVINYGQSDLIAGNGTVSGYAVRTHKNGDKTFYKYRGQLRAVTQGGVRETEGEGTVELIGGTGRFANVRGSGTWTAPRGQPATIKMELDY